MVVIVQAPIQLSLLDLADRINEAHNQCEQSFQSALLHAKEAGDYLIEARTKIEADQGKRKFKSWVEQNCEFARPTAYRYIKLASQWDNLICLTRETDKESLSVRQAIALLTESETEDIEDDRDETIDAEFVESGNGSNGSSSQSGSPVNPSKHNDSEPDQGLPSDRFNQDSEDTDPTQDNSDEDSDRPTTPATTSTPVSQQSGYDGNEWYTPADVIEMVRSFYGGAIDLDPASCEAAQQIVQAQTYFTKEDDGLEQVWHGRVWMNPPYSFPLIKDFTTYAAMQYEDGTCEES